jgi:hypothetical protein
LTEGGLIVEQILKKGGKRGIWRGDIRWIIVRENGALRILRPKYPFSPTIPPPLISFPPWNFSYFLQNSK